MKDLTGKVFCKWTVIKETVRSNCKTRQWLCFCECGAASRVQQNNLTSGKSTGCIKCRNKYIKHGLTSHKLYSTWKSMKTRCYNKNRDSYKYYGAKGITVCNKWHEFDGFLEDMGDSYSDGLSLDRLDSNKGYSKDNCRWATHEQQSNNRSNNLQLLWCGKYMTEAELSKATGVPRTTIQARRRKGASVKEMVHGFK